MMFKFSRHSPGVFLNTYAPVSRNLVRAALLWSGIYCHKITVASSNAKYNSAVYQLELSTRALRSVDDGELRFLIEFSFVENETPTVTKIRRKGDKTIVFLSLRLE
jgi:hypothetical protein